ncbi:hypothetical protein [Fredinandcohnia sp. 179-A 10B2 NHS]|uniref:hypothetical protein n=1 Tax=Fredinandcohnia sp. 179-A 10B2 NHS TaxID=3235176 RepID=UPI0039A15ED3
MNYIDFKRIEQALNGTYKVLQNEMGEEITPLESISDAKQNLLNAMSHSTSIEVDFLRYTSK